MSVYIGVPAYGPIEPSFLRSLCTALLVCREAGIAVELDIVGNCSLIAKARNEIANRFLAADFDALFFLDADIEFTAVDFVRVLERPEPLVAGAYRTKEELVRFTCEPVVPNEWRDGMLKVSSIGTGFMRIKREVLELMAPRMPRYGDTVSFFNVGIRDGVYVGEDYAFCRDYGGDIWAYPATLNHHGRHAYGGHFTEWLEWFNDRTANHQPGATAHRETPAGAIPNCG